MKPYEARLLRSETLPKYDITIKPLASGRESSPSPPPKVDRVEEGHSLRSFRPPSPQGCASPAVEPTLGPPPVDGQLIEKGELRIHDGHSQKPDGSSPRVES